MSLEKLVDNSRTDKNTIHSYLPVYENLLIKNKFKAKNILEIGIQDGGSIKLWADYFINAKVVGIDIIDIDSIHADIKNNDRITIYASSDAYNIEFFNNNFLNKDVKFDLLVDDGPHTLQSMIEFITNYSQIMTDDGILIIEDIQSQDWIDILKNSVPENLKKYIKIYDLRQNKGRYDDILFTIDKFNIE